MEAHNCRSRDLFQVHSPGRCSPGGRCPVSEGFEKMRGVSVVLAALVALPSSSSLLTSRLQLHRCSLRGASRLDCSR